MTMRLFGSAFILIGTSIGAGMLGLPLVSGAVGFFSSELVLIGVWAVMLLTGLMVLEVSLALKAHRNSFNSMAKETLGSVAQVISWIAVLLLLYSLTAAYITGDSSLLSEMFQHTFGITIANWVNALLFTLIFGGAVFLSTRTVDLFTRLLMSAKGLALVLVLVIALPKINVTYLVVNHSGGLKYLWGIIPIFFTSFGYHTSIPSIVNYAGKHSKPLARVILISTIVPLVCYTLWLVTALGIIPLSGSHSFQLLAERHASVGSMIQYINFLTNSPSVTFGINLFANLAMTTSFLGVSLGLFDFLADGLRRTNTRAGRFGTALMTFVLPLGFALFYPQGFILALGYAAIFVAILLVILPPLMVYKLRRSKVLRSPYRLWGGDALLFAVLAIGIILLVICIASSLQLLPTA